MREYFKMLEDILPEEYKKKSIKDITIEMATKAGYHRGEYTFKNGSKRIRTLYDRKFDDILTSAFLVYYKPLFIGKLSKHPELSQHHVDIINRTFQMVMTCIDLDKIVNDSVIHKYVNLALLSRIRDVLYIRGSDKRVKQMENGDKNAVRMNTAINYMALSFEDVTESRSFPDSMSDMYTEDILMDLKNIVKDSAIGQKLLNAMLSTNCKISLNSIDTFMDLDRKECTEFNKILIQNQYNKIKSVVWAYTDGSFDNLDKWKKCPKIKYSFE